MPLVSVLLATHDDDRFLGEAVESVLTQTLTDLELIVVDDASRDGTARFLAGLGDDRVVIVRNDEQAGLAASLNRGLDRASGRYVARLDSDDIAAHDRLERQVSWMRARPEVGVVGTGVRDIDANGHTGRVHYMPRGATALRWHALFSSPFFHPTVLVDRELLERHGLRYDASFLESEDYDLWTRAFEFTDGDNLQEVLVFKRVHPGQASFRRAELQEFFQRRIALREIARVAPALSAADAELAWRLGSARGVPLQARMEAGSALRALMAEFERRHGPDREVRLAAAKALGGAKLAGAMRKVARHVRRRAVQRPQKHGAVRVTVVSPEPTPYRSPLFDRLAASPELDLTVIYAASTVADRGWSVQPQHRAAFLRGAVLPGARRLLRHDYPVTPGVTRALRRSRPDVVVVSGWSTFAAQAAIAWSRARSTPYVLHVESHDRDSRAGWRRAVKGAIVPRLLRGASSVLVVGSAARESVIARGAAPERVRIFANTIDVPRWVDRARELSAGRAERRALAGIADEEIVVLCAGRLVTEKGIDTLARALAATGDARLSLLLAGSGPECERLLELVTDLALLSRIEGDLPEEVLAQKYVDADIFALLSRHEPWGVVVNEAAASGLPLVLSDRVGAASDLLSEGDNGFLVPADDVEAASAAVERLAHDSALRSTMGARSREVVREWGYDSSIDNFLAAVREATASR